MKGILFLCIGNSARSQMAEGLARAWLPKNIRIESAGSNPTGKVHPLAIEAMQELGISIQSHFSKHINTLNLNEFDTVITLCAEEICPVALVRDKMHQGWNLPDPASDPRLDSFKTIRDQIALKIKTELLNPRESL